jgi:hypothetical protein
VKDEVVDHRNRSISAKARANVWHIGLAVLGLLLLVGVVDAVVAQAPVPTDPGFVGTILASHGVVSAVRIAIIFGAAYLVLSVVALARRGRWLTRVGPAEAGEVVYAVDEKQEVSTALAEATEEIHWLRSRLQAADDLQHTLVAEIRSRGSHDPH